MSASDNSKAHIANEIDAIDLLLKQAYQRLEGDTPSYKWNALKVRMTNVKRIVTNAISSDMMPEDTAKRDQFRVTLLENASKAIDQALEVLDNNDGSGEAHDQIAKYTKLKADLLKRMSDARKASQEMVAKEELFEEMDALLVIINRAINGRLPNRRLAALIKNDIATGFARRRALAAGTEFENGSDRAADTGAVRRGDGSIQTVGVAKDPVRRTVGVRDKEGDQATDPRTA